MARDFVAASSQYLQLDAAVISAYPFTLAAWVRLGSVSADQAIVVIGHSSLSDRWDGLFYDDGNHVFWAWSRTSGGGGTNAIAQVTTTLLTTNEWHHVCGVFASDTDRRVFMDGAGKGTTATSVAVSERDRTNVGVLTAGGARSQYTQGRIADVQVYNVALSDADVASLSRTGDRARLRPAARVADWPLWGRHSPEINLRNASATLTVTGATAAEHAATVAPRYWGFRRTAATGGAFTLAAEAGVYALTGSAADLRATRLLDAVAGAYALVGADAVAVAARIISSDPGAYALTGSAADLRATRILDAVAGVYAVAGSDAAVIAARILQSDPGAYVVTGSAAELLYGQPGTFTLAAEPGAYALTGSAASPMAGRLLEAAPGTYAVAGSTMEPLATRVLVLAPGVYLVSGSAATLIPPTIATPIEYRSDFRPESLARSWQIECAPADHRPARLTRTWQPDALDADYTAEPQQAIMGGGGG